MRLTSTAGTAASGTRCNVAEAGPSVSESSDDVVDREGPVRNNKQILPAPERLVRTWG
jgi:hypothetical protein